MQAINTTNLNLRREPSFGPNIIQTIPAKSIVEILMPAIEGFAKVIFNGIVGFVSAQFLSAKDTTPVAVIRRKNFFEAIKKNGLFPALKQSQVEGIEATLTEWEWWIFNSWVDNDLRKLAYILATDYHEGMATMQPIKEKGGDAYFVRKYWTNQRKAKELGNRHAQDAIDYCGKGKPQITGRNNYIRLGKILGYDLVGHPDLMFDLKIATEVMFEGMLAGVSLVGDFTGVSLEKYFTKKTEDPEGARKVINGTDDKELIAGYYRKFLSALKA